MAEQQIPKLVASLVEHQSAFAPMATKDAQWVIQNAKAAITLFVQAVESRQRDEQVKLVEPQPLLTLAGTVKVRLAPKFVASDFFKVNTKKNASVKIAYVGDNFKAWFLAPSVSEEETAPDAGPHRTPGVQSNATEVNLRYQMLNRHSVDGPIIAELGGEAKAETTLADVSALMVQQANGENGTLLTNGYANIFYVRDVGGVLRVVNVSWFGGGWRVGAGSVEGPREWFAGHRVFSRDS